MRVAIVANCQGESIVAGMKAMNPDVEADFIFTPKIDRGEIEIADIFSGYNYVVSHPNVLRDIPNGMSNKVKLFPVIAFDGYHPDIIFVRGVRKGSDKVEAVTNDMVIYHSAIAFFGYMYNLSVDDTINYFNHFVFSRLQYPDRWELARDALLAEGDAVGMPLNAEFSRWSRQGCFMFSNNHPRLHVLIDVARRIMEDLGIPVRYENVEDFLPDPLKAMPIWPIYPAIAEKLNLRGSYAFKMAEPNGILDLRTFVQRSYDIYAQFEKSSLHSLMISPSEMGEMLNAPPKNSLAGNPYRNIDERQFWKKSVADIDPATLNPVFTTNFQIEKSDKVATAGSCFAQHIARTLSASGFNYYIAETAPPELSSEDAASHNYGVFSARYGNLYTVRQLVQLIERANGKFEPDERYWLRKDGAFIDPFRPQIEPDGFVDFSALKASREEHFTAVRAMISNMDIFIFTLGLTEGWRSKVDGAVFPLAPGVAGGEPDFDRYEFVNFSVEEVTADLFKAMDLIKAVNPECRIILTVSPVPLIATYEPQHALVATTYSKSVLRVAAQNVANNLKNVDYFGSYEIITGSFNRGAYFLDDLRSVDNDGVAHVMRVFMESYTAANGDLRPKSEKLRREVSRSATLFDVVCDEEAIANF